MKATAVEVKRGKHLDLTSFQAERVERILSLHGEFAGLVRKTLAVAIEVGALLVELKPTVGHGQWGAWLQQRFPFDERTAQRYMKAWRNKELLISDNVSDLSKAHRRLTASEKPVDTVFSVPIVEDLPAQIPAVAVSAPHPIRHGLAAVLRRLAERLER